MSNAVAAAENAANKDLSNLSANGESRIKDLAKSAASWNVQTNGGATAAVSGGDNVNFVDGKNITITNTGREITVATKDDVTFNKVTVGGMTLDNNGIDAGNKEIKNVAAGTTPNSAVNKQQMDSAISNATANVGFSTAGNTGTGSVSNGQTLTITGTNGIETNASGQSITVGLDAATRAQINNATTTANNAAKKDLSNIDNAGKQVIKDTAAWNVKVNGAAAETVKVAIQLLSTNG